MSACGARYYARRNPVSPWHCCLPAAGKMGPQFPQQRPLLHGCCASNLVLVGGKRRWLSACARETREKRGMGRERERETDRERERERPFWLKAVSAQSVDPVSRHCKPGGRAAKSHCSGHLPWELRRHSRSSASVQIYASTPSSLERGSTLSSVPFGNRSSASGGHCAPL